MDNNLAIRNYFVYAVMPNGLVGDNNHVYDLSSQADAEALAERGSKVYPYAFTVIENDEWVALLRSDYPKPIRYKSMFWAGVRFIHEDEQVKSIASESHV